MTNFNPISRIPSPNTNQVISGLMSDMAGRLSAAERAAALTTLSTYAPWVYPTFVGAGFSSTTPLTSNEELRYYRDPVGRVYIDGKFTSMGVDPDLQIVFTLPVGYRPDRAIKRVAGYALSSPPGSSASDLIITIDLNGNVVWPSSGLNGTTTYELEIRDMSFRALVSYSTSTPPPIPGGEED